MPKSKSPNAANPAGSPAIKAAEAEFKRNLTRYRNWLSAKSVHRAVRMVLPSYYDGNSQKLKTIVDDSLQPRTDGKKRLGQPAPRCFKGCLSGKHLADSDFRGAMS